MKDIACIIVTFNRKALLHNCLDAVFAQTYKPKTVYLVDNASTDGTQDMLHQEYHLESSSSNGFSVKGIDVKYLQLPENIGGAGGFYTGMKTAFEDLHYDGFWVMDDDGEPDSQCLKMLVPYLDKHDYIAPEVVDTTDSSKMSFEYCGMRDEFEAKAENGIVKDIACPFNGILYSHKLLSTIGYPKKEMFIWGDEENYALRAVKAGFDPITIIGAIHKHPANRVLSDSSIFGKIDVAPQMWRCYCRYRNHIYNRKDEMSVFGMAYVFLNHIYYYLIKKHSLKWTKCYIEAFIAGCKGDFSGLAKYKKQ